MENNNSEDKQYDIDSKIVHDYNEQGQFDKAIRILNQYISVFTKDDKRLGNIYFMLGESYRGVQNYVKAEEYFQRSVDHGEEVEVFDPSPLRELVSTLAWQGKMGQAWKYYARLQIRDSNPIHTRAMLIPIMVKNGQYQAAVDSFELLPKGPYFHLLPHVAEAQEGLSNYSTASHHLQQYLNGMDPTHPHVPVALCRFAMVQLKMFNGQKAVELAQECVKRCKPENKEIRAAALNLVKEITPLLKKTPQRAGKRQAMRSN